ncbi:MAG: endolytic transglycosylase MltG [Muribaculaceae bacterium]|nr:endolytic transglycosylase MltG [Muribaculaceae bacterium]MBR0023698.1 endolytic transglycosylase MltG [Muribaculaceae bacterium]
MGARNNRPSAKGKNNKKKLPRWLIITAVVAVVLLAVAAILAAPFLTVTADKEAMLLIKRGTTTEAVGEMIANEVSPEFSDKVMELLKMTGGDLSTRQGAFKIKEGESSLSVANHLRRGAPDEIKVTINNIRTKEQLAKLLSKKLMHDDADFLKAFNDKDLCASLEKNPDNVTGLFLADTYQFLWDVEPVKLLESMKKFSDSFWDSDRKEKAEKLGLTPDQVIALAAIVEGETAKADEKGMVARLYLNRLKKNMKLQADPTVKFAIGDFALRRLRLADTRIESPWNTYYVEGLPPGPICIPEKSSIDAVLDAPEHDYIYMCAKEDFSGYHNFAVTYSDHEANAKRYQKALDERNITR